VKGFSLIELVLVMALIALSLALAGPRVGAGLGRLELERTAQSVRNFVKIGRIQAQRMDKEYYVSIDRKQDSLTLLDSDMKVVRQEKLPSSVQVILESNSDVTDLTISSAGIVHGKPIVLRGRAGEVRVVLR
jgi:prepilin-type N-terminal cleavage/methylation domain-containing protein